MLFHNSTEGIVELALLIAGGIVGLLGIVLISEWLNSKG